MFIIKKLTTFVLICCWFASSYAQTSTTSKWPVATPEEAGVSSADLNLLFDYVREHHTRVHSVQILRHGKLILDAYFYPYQKDSKHDVASVTKSITSTLTGIAIDKKYIPDIHANALAYFPNNGTDDKQKQKITLEDLITMRSGLDCGADLSNPKINLDQRLIEIRRCPDWIKCTLDLPMSGNPGEHFAYCNANCHLISAIVAKATGKTLYDFASKELFGPLGILGAYWPSDPNGINYGWSDLQLHPYDMLKIGQLMLHQGKWGSQQIVSATWLHEATTEHVLNTGGKDHYGYFWWLPGGDHPDVFEAVGRGGQRITVWPANDMVIVFTGGGFETTELIPFIVQGIKSPDAIPGNAAAYQRLVKNTALIKDTPIPHPHKNLPAIAMHVSGKTFALSANALNMTTLQLNFNKSEEALMNLTWDGHLAGYPLGLDGVERFSLNPIVKLSQACKGEWIDDHSFEIQLNLVGGINFYTLRITFANSEKTISVKLSEGTGLNDEVFSGQLSN